MSAQVARDTESIKSNIKQALMNKAGIVHATDGTMRSIQRILGVHCSGSQFDRAIGSLIHHGELLRHRAEPTGRDDERPLTIRFANFARSESYHCSFAQ